LVYSSRAQGFGLVPCCVFCRHSSTRFLTGAHPHDQSLSLIDFLVHSSVDFLPACLSLFVLRRVFFPCCCARWSRWISSLPVVLIRGRVNIHLLLSTPEIMFSLVFFSRAGNRFKVRFCVWLACARTWFFSMH
jgi:hypothetical protein